MANELITIPAAEVAVTASDFMPLMTITQAVERKTMMNQFIGQILHEDQDYGKIPGQQKKVLLKPGAEKLCSLFGLAPRYTAETVIEDWNGANHGGEQLFYYEYKCTLSRGQRVMGEAIGSCNSWESKYRYRWVNEDVASQREDYLTLAKKGGKISEPVFAVEKAETSGKYGKPAEYWQKFHDAIADGRAAKVQKQKKDGGRMDAWEIDSTLYRIPNPDIADVINTIQKMAQKRALVAAVLVVTNCSDAFTQDIEDFEEVGPAPMPTQSVIRVPSGREVPEELRAGFAEILKDSSKITPAFTHFGDLLKQNGAEAEYTRICAEFRKKCPKGTETKGQVLDVLLDMWEAIQMSGGIHE